MTVMDTLQTQRKGIADEARNIIAAAKDAGRNLTADEVATLQDRNTKILDLDSQIGQAKAADDVAASIMSLTDEEAREDSRARNGRKGGERPLTLGEHFFKAVGGEDVWRAKARNSGARFAAPEYAADGVKAASDAQTIGSVWGTGGAFPTLVEFDRTIVQGLRPRLLIADLLGAGTISGNAITYLIEQGVEGAFTTVAEGGQKPQLHFLDPTTATDALKKIAGFIKITDEMLEDLPFLVSEINSRLLYERAKMEEAQVTSGNGTGTNVLGLMNRSGVQVLARGTLASGDTAPDALFRAITAVSTVGGLDADGIVIHPTDYQTIRLAKDGNGQYYGGGFFAGQYGSGTLQDQPPIWGLRTVVSTAVPVGTALVGSFAQAATLYRKGGVRVDSTNSDGTDFTKNITTFRVENRVALAVRRPAGLVKVTLTPAP